MVFRRERCTADAIEQCYKTLAKADRAQWILEGDIERCFDNISHDWILANVLMDKAVLRKWLKAGFMENQVWHDSFSGTPQGGTISPVLANMALDGLETLLLERFPRELKRGGKRHYLKVNLIRYADDFVITGASRELLEQQVKPVVEAFLADRGIRLSPEKTVVTLIDKGFDFLGQNVRKYRGKLLAVARATRHPVRPECHHLLAQSPLGPLPPGHRPPCLLWQGADQVLGLMQRGGALLGRLSHSP